MVLTRIAWAAIVTSVQMVSYDLQTTTWHSWLTFFYSLMFGKEPFPNLNIGEQFVMSYLIKNGNLTYSEFVDSVCKINCATSITVMIR